MICRWTLGVAAIGTLLVAMPGAGRAQTVFGHVVDSLTGGPLPSSAVILLDSTGTSRGYVLSDSTGRFVLRAPRQGRYQVYVDQLSYRMLVSDTLVLEKGARVELLLRVAPVPVELDPMSVTVRRQEKTLQRVGFYKREKLSAVGNFLDPEKVRDERPFMTTDLLRQMPHVKLGLVESGGYVPMAGEGIQFMHSPTDATVDVKACLMKVVVDGVDVPMDLGISLDEIVPAQDVLAVEVYPNIGVGAPIQYRGPEAACGVILIWTKWGGSGRFAP